MSVHLGILLSAYLPFDGRALLSANQWVDGRHLLLMRRLLVYLGQSVSCTQSQHLGCWNGLSTTGYSPLDCVCPKSVARSAFLRLLRHVMFHSIIRFDIHQHFIWLLSWIFCLLTISCWFAHYHLNYLMSGISYGNVEHLVMMYVVHFWFQSNVPFRPVIWWTCSLGYYEVKVCNIGFIRSRGGLCILQIFLIHISPRSFRRTVLCGWIPLVIYAYQIPSLLTEVHFFHIHQCTGKTTSPPHIIVSSWDLTHRNFFLSDRVFIRARSSSMYSQLMGPIWSLPLEFKRREFKRRDICKFGAKIYIHKYVHKTGFECFVQFCNDLENIFKTNLHLLKYVINLWCNKAYNLWEIDRKLYYIVNIYIYTHHIRIQFQH